MGKFKLDIDLLSSQTVSLYDHFQIVAVLSSNDNDTDATIGNSL